MRVKRSHCRALALSHTHFACILAGKIDVWLVDFLIYLSTLGGWP